MLGLDPGRLTACRLIGHQLMPPQIAPGHHLTRATRALIDDDTANGLATTQRDSLIHCRFERHGTATPALRIRRDDGHGPSALNALLQTFGRKTAKHHRMNRADTRTGLHGNHAFNRHRHVDHHPVTLLNALRSQSIGKRNGARQQLAISDFCHLPIVSLENQGDFLPQSSLDIAIQTVVGHIQAPIGKPSIKRRAGFIEHLCKRLLPTQMLTCQTRPETRVILLGLLAQRLIRRHAGHTGPGNHLGRRWKNPVFLQYRLYGGHVLTPAIGGLLMDGLSFVVR